MPIQRSQQLLVALAGLGVAAGPSGCLPSDDASTQADAAPGDGGAAAAAGAGGHSGSPSGSAGAAGRSGAPNAGGTSGGAGAPADAGAAGSGGAGCEPPRIQACAGTLAGRSALTPLDIYIMFDQSGSMSTLVGASTRIEEVRSAVQSFLLDPRSAGINTGIGYFGDNQITLPDGGRLDPEETSCDPADYEVPSVPMGTLPAHTEAVMTSLSAAVPTGETPTPAAIEGACRYLRGWAQGHPDRVPALLLVTDGEPKAPITSERTNGACAPTLEQAEAAAAACLEGDPAIRTYVLGVGPLLENLHRIAAAGGTEQAFLVQDGRVPVLGGLDDVREASGACELQAPATGVDPGSLNLVQTINDCAHEPIVHVGSAAGCDPDRGGWYYDDPQTPSVIPLCAMTCELSRQSGTSVSYVVGCERLETFTAP